MKIAFQSLKYSTQTRRCSSLDLLTRLLADIILNRIVIGDVNGQLKSLSTKLSSLHAKNNFSFAIVAGNLFDEDDEVVADLLSEKILIPLPTYFTVGMKPLPQCVVERLAKDEDVSFLPGYNCHFLTFTYY